MSQCRTYLVRLLVTNSNICGFRDADRECRSDETKKDVTGDNRHVLTQDRGEKIAHGVFSVRGPDAFSQWIMASEQ